MKSILLVDDQAHVLRVVKLSLDRNGFEVDTALGGNIALQMMLERPYDVVITASDMPSMTGRQLCESIQRDFSEALPLIFVLVNDDTDQEALWSNSMQMTELVEKPMSLRWLVARLNEYFGHYDRVSNG